MTLQEKLKLIQKLSSKPQEGLARDLGVSFATFNSWINGRSLPRKKALERIDQLYLKLTGQSVIPQEVLEAKKQFLKQKGAEYKNILQTISKHKDIYDQFMLSLTYNTNRIEGSTLTEPETAAILFENAALPDKSIIEQLEVKNHQAAVHFLFKHLGENGQIDEAFILRLHSILMNSIREDAGFYRKHGVRIVGTNVPTANHLKVPELMKKLSLNIKRKRKDLVTHVSEVHSHFEQVHPFSDGNGRVGRLLLNAMLMKQNLPPAVIKQELRRFYALYLNKSQLHKDFNLLEDFICDAILEGFNILERK